jgi:hypothetical protein
MYVYTHIYIYTVYIYIHIHTYILYMYNYIHIINRSLDLKNALDHKSSERLVQLALLQIGGQFVLNQSPAGVPMGRWLIN